MKDVVTNKPLTIEHEDVRLNRRCSALLLNQLPPKEKDPRSFILPCSIGRLDFNNALADLGASISIMPFSMYKRLGIGKLETIKMNIELADNSKCIPKGIVRNLLIKIDKFIFPIDFIILDVVEDFRMPVILGRPLLTTAHAKVDESKNDNDCINIEWNDLSLNDWLKIKYGEVDETVKKKILTEHWRKRFKVDYDDSSDFYDPDQCEDGMSDDEDGIERIIDYLEPTSYDGFVDLDEEEYNKRRCEMQENDKKHGKKGLKCSILINRGLIQAIQTSLPPHPIGEATKASNLRKIPPGV
ncbi:hypothetical protein Tco_0915180 [Tanacetum coccineum]